MLEISRELGPKEAMPALISVPESKQDAEATETSSAPPAAADAVATPPAAAGTPVSNGGTDTADDAPPGKGEKGERHIDLHSSGDSVCGGRKRNASKFISFFFSLLIHTKTLPPTVASAPPEPIVAPPAAAPSTDTSVSEMNELLQSCFLIALKRSLKDKDLPILLNVFFANHLLAVKPKDKNLDMKKTSYKKVR